MIVQYYFIWPTLSFANDLYKLNDLDFGCLIFEIVSFRNLFFLSSD